MVIPIDDEKHMKVACQPGGLVVELVGIAGAGKSTLYRALQKKATWFLFEHIPSIWDFSNIPFYVKNIISLIPVLIKLLGKGNRFLNVRELVCMAILNDWSIDLMRNKADNGGKTIVIDQGPISMIAYLQLKGPLSLKNSNIQWWWDKVFEQWIQTIDLVVWLDISYETSIYRINNRPQKHSLKGKTYQESCDVLTKYRTKYEEVLSKFWLYNRNSHVIRIDSGENTVDEIVGTVISEIDALD